MSFFLMPAKADIPMIGIENPVYAEAALDDWDRINKRRRRRSPTAPPNVV